jgi:hypothetical protein
VSTTLPVRGLRQLTAAGNVAVPPEGTAWSVVLPAYGGAILEWQQPQ